MAGTKEKSTQPRINVPISRSLRNALNRAAKSAGVTAKAHLVNLLAEALGK